MSDDTIMADSESPATDAGALTTYQRSQHARSGDGGPVVVMNAEAQSIIRNQLLSFLTATQREVMAISNAQDSNNHQVRLQLELALDAMLTRVRADAENNVQLSHDELFRALAARVDAGIEHIGDMRQHVEDRAIQAAESHMSALVTASKNGITNDLIQAVEDRVHGNITRAIVEAKESVETQAIVATDNRISKVEDQLRDRLHNALYQSLQARLRKALTSAEETVDERALSAARSHVASALEQTEAQLRDRLDRFVSQRLSEGVDDAIISVKEGAGDQVALVAERLFASLTAATKKELDELIEARLNSSFSARLTASIGDAIAAIQQGVEERALAVVEERAVANVEDRAAARVEARAIEAVKERALALLEERMLVAGSGAEALDEGTLQRAIDSMLNARCTSQLTTLFSSKFDDMKADALESVKKYEAIGKLTAERRCSEALTRLDTHVDAAIAEVKTNAALEAASSARLQVVESEKRLRELHEKLLRELQKQVGVASVPEIGPSAAAPQPSTHSATISANDQSNLATTTLEKSSLPKQSVHEIEIEMAGLQIKVRARPITDRYASVSEAHGRLFDSTSVAKTSGGKFEVEVASAIEAAKKSLSATIDAAVNEHKERVKSEKIVQQSLTEMQARIQAKPAAKSEDQTQDLSATGKRRLQSFLLDLED